MDLRAKIPPVPVALLAAAAMWGAARLTPGWHIPLPAPGVIEAAFGIVAALVVALAVFEFRRMRTTVDPVHPAKASKLVTSGVYRITRNPMYLGLLLLLAAYAVHLANPLAIPGLVAFVAYLNRFQIAPEEVVLSAKFGDEFTAYRQHVRRWL